MFKETGDSRYIYRNELDKACFQHDMTYGDFKDLAQRTAADNILRDKAFDIAKDPKHDGYQRGLASVVYKCFDKRTAGSGIKSIPQNEQLPEELHNISIIRKLKKRKVYSTFKGSIWGADLADMQLTSKFNKGFRFLLSVIDIFSKYAWVVRLKDKKGASIVIASVVYKCFDKRTAGSGIKSIPQNEQLPEELHNISIIRKLKKRKVYSTFKGSIWGADLADMQLTSKFNKGFRFLLSVIDIFRKYAWVVRLKDKKGASIVNAFQSIFKKSNRKPNKIWVDKGSEFYNNSFKKWLQDNDIAIYSTHNDENLLLLKDLQEEDLQIHDFNIKKCVY